ncbi:FAD-dependent monooxygenase, partial [Amaricoccus sp. W119]|uniref:FAD-dependent monooxygenase n=1 Tax=Amaricoccus sp. W119 TaxID=3391833 RepID=UPI0039A62228
MIQSGGDHPVRTETTDVLIAGAGPAGLTLTALLARAGVKAITVSRWPGVDSIAKRNGSSKPDLDVPAKFGEERLDRGCVAEAFAR